MTTRRVRMLLAEMAEMKRKFPEHWVWRDAMSPNKRVDIYSELTKLLGRPPTPDERNRFDKVLDSFGAPTR